MTASLRGLPATPSTHLGYSVGTPLDITLTFAPFTMADGIADGRHRPGREDRSLWRPSPGRSWLAAVNLDPL